VKERSRPVQNLPALARKQLPCCLRQGLAIAMVFVLSIASSAPSLLAAPAPAKARPNPPRICELGTRDYIGIPCRVYRAPVAVAVPFRLCSYSGAVSGLCPTACAIVTLPFGSFPSYSML
jgi:hypothetical protein